MQVPADIQEWLYNNGSGAITRIDGLGGGCIHQSSLLQTGSGTSYFLKQNQQVPPDMFQKEARGLTALSIPGGPVVPKVFLVGENYLLLEDLQPAPRVNDFWDVFGRQLAVVHLQVNEKFGFLENNYIGSNPQDNTWTENGYVFFQEYRLKPQIRLAQKISMLKSHDLQMLDKLLLKLTDLIPDQDASLLHGDLWSGNLISNGAGVPAVIDPAVYYGWAESDLAMMDLFGSPPAVFFQAYQELRQLEPDFRSRFPLYNLYHLLNHLNLFGSGYLGQIRAILSEFAG